jgi:hypothetical protein
MLSVIMLSVAFYLHYAECCYAECHYADCHYADCHYTVIMLTVIVLIVIMLTVVVPCQGQQVGKSFYNVAPSSSFTIAPELSSLAAMY